MRYHKTCALSLTLISSLSFAQTDKINCQAFAAEQLKEIKQEYYGALTRDEAILARDVAERSCRALFDSVEEERAAIQASQTLPKEKAHWWEDNDNHTKDIPAIKLSHQRGGK